MVRVGRTAITRTGRGRAKLLLFGEHAAVHGFPAVGIGLPESTEVSVLEGGGRGWRLPALPPAEARRLSAFLSSAAAIWPSLSRGRGELRISSTIPPSLGFGSSAALCVALAEAFAKPGCPPEEIWSAAHRAESFFHGSPSGIDTGLSLLGGPRCFRPSGRPPAAGAAREAGPLPEHRLLDASLHLVVGAVPRRESTAALVGGLAARTASGETEAIRLVEELGDASDRAIELMEASGSGSSSGSSPDGALSGLGPLLETARAALGRLGLGDRGIDRIVRAGLELGAIGGKPSGAGAGGAFFLLFPTRDKAAASMPLLAEFARAEGIELAAPLRAVEARADHPHGGH